MKIVNPAVLQKLDDIDALTREARGWLLRATQPPGHLPPNPAAMGPPQEVVRPFYDAYAADEEQDLTGGALRMLKRAAELVAEIEEIPALVTAADPLAPPAEPTTAPPAPPAEPTTDPQP